MKLLVHLVKLIVWAAIKIRVQHVKRDTNLLKTVKVVQKYVNKFVEMESDSSMNAMMVINIAEMDAHNNAKNNQIGSAMEAHLTQKTNAKN